MSILNVEHLTHGFGDRAIFSDVSFRLLKGEHIGLVGANGEGKSTFMSIVTGKLMPDEGKVEWAKNVRAGYLDQHAVLEKGMTIQEVLKSAFDPLLQKEQRMNEICDLLGSADEEEMNVLMEELGTIQDELTLHDFYVIDSKVEEVARALGLLDLGLDRDVTDLSGGQRTKVLLGKLLLEKPDILLLDEPTNHLDSEMADWLEDYLKKFKGALLMITHDRYFLDRVVRRIFAFEGGGAIRQYEGGYTDYQAACGERIAAEMEASGTASGQERGRGQKTGGAFGAGTSDAAETAKDKNRGRQREKKLKFSYMEQKEWETIEDDIAALEEAIADLEQQMQDSARDYTALNGIIKEKEEKEALLEEKMDRWMYLNDLAEKIEAQAAAHK